jgi:hypothetical protein
MEKIKQITASTAIPIGLGITLFSGMVAGGFFMGILTQKVNAIEAQLPQYATQKDIDYIKEGVTEIKATLKQYNFNIQ